jgi:serine/threonine-protein kinase RsbW
VSTPDHRIDPEETDVPDEVELTLPARPELLSLARLTVATVAARADFDYEEIEDLRLAIDELCSPLVTTNSGAGHLHLRYRWERSWLEVSCTIEGGAPALAKVDAEADGGEREISDRILEALVDEHGSTVVGDSVEVWLRKRRPEVTA